MKIYSHTSNSRVVENKGGNQLKVYSSNQEQSLLMADTVASFDGLLIEQTTNSVFDSSDSSKADERNISLNTQSSASTQQHEYDQFLLAVKRINQRIGTVLKNVEAQVEGFRSSSFIKSDFNIYNNPTKDHRKEIDIDRYYNDDNIDRIITRFGGCDASYYT